MEEKKYPISYPVLENGDLGPGKFTNIELVKAMDNFGRNNSKMKIIKKVLEKNPTILDDLEEKIKKVKQ